MTALESRQSATTGLNGSGLPESATKLRALVSTARSCSSFRSWKDSTARAMVNAFELMKGNASWVAHDSNRSA